MDIWSVGCILAEMFCNKPLFPGKNYLDQISKIQEVLGTPTEEDTAFIKNAKAKAFLSSLPERPKVAWPKLFPKVSEYDKKSYLIKKEEQFCVFRQI